jgi:sugar/nucleoside kinase (ribokinase family)
MICTLGDLLLDVVVTGSGALQRATDTYSDITAGPGGQAANVAAWVAALGGRARLVAKRVADPVGNMVLDQLARRGVEVVGPVVGSEAAHTGVVVSLSGFEGERSMLTDRGVSPSLGPDELRPEWFEACSWLHLPMYSLAAGPVRRASLRARQWVERASIDLSSLTVLSAAGKGEVTALLGGVRPEVVFATEEEAALTDLSMVPTVVTKLGRRGVAVNGALHPAHPCDVVDTTGAGDAFAAGFLLGGTELGLAAAARAVSKRGAMP